MAKAGTASKKSSAKKTASRSAAKGRAGAARTKKKSSAKASKARTGTSKKKTVGKKNSVSKKKVTSRAAKKSTTRASATASKKKSTKKAATPAAKKKTAKKPITKKKTTTKKKSTRNSSSKASEPVSTKVTASADAGSEATPKKKVKKKRQSAADARKRGRSVAEVASTSEADEQGFVFINGRRVRMISTAGKVLNKKSRTAAAETLADDNEPVKLMKTKLTKKQLNYYRDLLLIKRAEIVGDLSAMEAAALRSSGGEISHMPIHMADIGSDTYEQDFTLGLAESERQQLREIDDALSRIEDRTYGVCQMTGKDIPKARLDAKPWAKYTIEAARLVESQMQR